ncbi:DUF6157 family protein [Microbacterium aurantiacum]|uniref:DUF6157 family protein n=1 Tax=Microbacterium aurantiacum TaxID=162393 RepID=UPI00343506E1
MHTTNYVDTFIEAAEDCPAVSGEEPPRTASPTIAGLHYELIAANPYARTSDEIIFETYARRAGIEEADREAAWIAFFSKGQPCLRSSPLGKRYGWGTHHDGNGRVAVYPIDSDEYNRLAADPTLAHTRAMRSRRR